MNKSKLFYAAAKIVIKNSSNEILLLRSKAKDPNVATKPYWDLPGGRLEEGQNFKTALSRELQEETGLNPSQLANLSLLTVTISNRNARQYDQPIGLVLVVYRADIAKAEIKLSDEHNSFAWVDKSNAQKRLAFKYPSEFTQLL